MRVAQATLLQGHCLLLGSVVAGLHGRESRVIPAHDSSRVDKPRQLAFGQYSVNKR